MKLFPLLCCLLTAAPVFAEEREEGGKEHGHGEQPCRKDEPVVNVDGDDRVLDEAVEERQGVGDALFPSRLHVRQLAVGNAAGRTPWQVIETVHLRAAGGQQRLFRRAARHGAGEGASRAGAPLRTSRA